VSFARTQCSVHRDMRRREPERESAVFLDVLKRETSCKRGIEIKRLKCAAKMSTGRKPSSIQ